MTGCYATGLTDEGLKPDSINPMKTNFNNHMFARSLLGIFCPPSLLETARNNMPFFENIYSGTSGTSRI
jgi:hypothetical protein